jgi:metal-responsive CopG/Arc/MetJ family transcriptional regulator
MNAAKTQNIAENCHNRIRFQLELSKSVMQRLDDLVELTDSSSRAEVIRRALGFYGLLVEQTKSGKRVEVVEDSGNRQQLIIL